MESKTVALVLFVIGCVTAQNAPLKVCIPDTNRVLCNNLALGDSQAECVPVASRVDCAIKLARREAEFGVFSEEETLLIAQQQPNDHRVIATIRDVDRPEPFAFEAVAVVSNSLTGGFMGLQGARYCHPGFDTPDQRWSLRVLKAFEHAAARSDRCPNAVTAGKSADEMEVETLNGFFSAACRPGPWSANVTVDADLKNRFPNLCSLCGPNNNCTGYSIDMGVTGGNVNNNNRHIQALECLRSNGNLTVAYVAWQHVREFFNNRSSESMGSFSILCDDETLRPLTTELLASTTSPCAIVRQPWSTILSNSDIATTIQANIRIWWPNGMSPGGGSWASSLFDSIVGGVNARIHFEESLVTPSNYTSSIRNIPAIDATTSCIPPRRWCTLSADEQTKCSWIRAASHILGIQPALVCLPRLNTFECLRDIQLEQIDFIVSSSNFGYLARQHYQLSPVKLLQNSRNAFTRVAAFVKVNTTQNNNITRFENLKGRKACFPEYGGIAYVAFVRAAQDIGVISTSECNYARAVGEFFDGACAPGALDASHALPDDSFNSTTLCTVCRPATSDVGNYADFTCTWDYSNLFFGNNGSLACLADPASDVVVLQTRDIDTHVANLQLQPSQYRALCRDNQLATNTGFTVADNCLLAHVVDAEVVTRRNDPLLNAMNVLLDTLEIYFGYTAKAGVQLINLEMFSPFDGISDLLFRDSAIGLTEPSYTTDNPQARNYIQLFQHLETCTGAAPPSPGFASRNIYSLITLVVMALMTRFVVY